ncbi:hypothetical protein HGRIS_004328 [Hohenbuehelia grisea]|uniref:GmrSD restriction endonucleases N-terminal domain-containing protein n=1 Tax=Hohenbuehelia grisea TaxID=104357 RepID=A0ABR3IPI9_9AGAR
MQIGIIDSIFRNFYIPPIIFAVKQYKDGGEAKTCIDGKQRLTSIHRFMDGLIPHINPHTGEKLWYKNVDINSAKTRKILPEQDRLSFAEKEIVCVEYQDINENDEREIFQRVQLGMALTPAEKLQVINTPRAAFVRELLTMFVNDNNGLDGGALNWDRERGADFRCVAQSVCCIAHYPSGIRNVGTMPQLKKWLSASDALPEGTMGMIKETYRVFVQLVSNKTVNRVFHEPEKIAPLEFICIPILIAMKRSGMSPAQLAATIGTMRAEVREAHVGTRMNDHVLKTILGFIANIQGPTAAVPDQDAAASTGEKRKRPKQDDDEDEDESYRPKAQKAKAKSKPKPTPASASAPKASSSTGSLPSVPVPGSDRMAALCTVKSLVQQRASAAASSSATAAAPSAPRASSRPGSSARMPTATTPRHQPTNPNAFVNSLSLPGGPLAPNPNSNSNSNPKPPTAAPTTAFHALPRRPPAQTQSVQGDTALLGNGLEAQLMASMNRPSTGGAAQLNGNGQQPGSGAGAGSRPKADTKVPNWSTELPSSAESECPIMPFTVLVDSCDEGAGPSKGLES